MSNSTEDESRLMDPMHSHRHIKRWRMLFVSFAVVALLSWSCSSLHAQQPEIILKIGDPEVFVGESTTLQVEIRNSEAPSAPDLKVIQEQFEVDFAGEMSNDQSQTILRNGRLFQSSTLSHIYEYRLTPKQAGSLQIPSLIATVDGKSIKSNTLSLRVLEIPEQDKVIPEIVSSHTHVYPTQSFTIKLRILVQPISELDPIRTLKQLRISPPTIQLSWLKAPDGLTTNPVSEWLQPLLSRNNVGFSINEVTADSGSLFERRRSPVFDLSNGRELKNGLNGAEFNYFVYELEREFLAEKAGDYSFGPAIIRGTLDTRFIAIAPAASVRVLDVPSPRPSNFTGGIGNYKVDATVTPNALRVGDPLTLTLQFSKGKNSGSLDLISVPDLNEMPEISEQFDIVDKNPIGRADGNTKRFSFALRPKRAGVTIPKLALTTFDPVSEEFREITTDPIAITVSNATASIAGGDLIGANASQKNLKEIKSRSEGIFHNLTDTSLVADERIDFFDAMRWIGGLWVVTGIAIASIIVLRNNSSDVGGQRRASARKKAHARLSKAKGLLSKGREKEAIKEIRASILGFVADTRNQIAEGMTISDVDAAMVDASVPVENRERLKSLLEKIESSEYGAIGLGDTLSVLKEASQWIDELSPYMERGSRK